MGPASRCWAAAYARPQHPISLLFSNKGLERIYSQYNARVHHINDVGMMTTILVREGDLGTGAAAVFRRARPRAHSGWYQRDACLVPRAGLSFGAFHEDAASGGAFIPAAAPDRCVGGVCTTVVGCVDRGDSILTRLAATGSPKRSPPNITLPTTAAITACMVSLYAVCMQRPLWRAQHRDAICSIFCVFWLVSHFMVMCVGRQGWEGRLPGDQSAAGPGLAAPFGRRARFPSTQLMLHSFNPPCSYRRSMALELFGDRIQLTHHTQRCAGLGRGRACESGQ